MTTWQVLAELFALVNQYGPQAATILTTAEVYIKAGNWAGLATYLEGLIASGTIQPTHTTQVQSLANVLKAA